jgi:hypothetical protein
MSYDDAEDESEAVSMALACLEDAIKHDVGATVFAVEDTKTGRVSVISADMVLGNVKNTIINIDQSINFAPSITINADATSKRGKDGKDGKDGKRGEIKK